MTLATDPDRVLQAAADAGEVPGVVALAADDQDVIYVGAFGRREAGGDEPVRVDTVFWIASMTKAVTSVAAMQLVERGLVTLDEPIADRLPDLAAVRVLAGFDDTGAPHFRPPRRQITLRHLLTHTAGFGYPTWNSDLRRFEDGAGTTLPQLDVPLVFDAGDRWEYGTNVDWIGRLVEHLSGQTLEEYFRDHIFVPLAMPDTGFHLDPDRRARLAGRHQRHPDRSLTPIQIDLPDRPIVYTGGGGMYSTGPDYLRFLRMLLKGGRLDGVEVLRSETVAEMGRNQIGDLNVTPLKTYSPERSNDAEFFPGMVKKWGLGFLINTEEAPTGRSASSLAWAGLGNTYYWIDPAKRVTGLILTQILPFADPTVLRLFAAFETAVYEGVRSRQ